MQVFEYEINNQFLRKLQTLFRSRIPKNDFFRPTFIVQEWALYTRTICPYSWPEVFFFFFCAFRLKMKVLSAVITTTERWETRRQPVSWRMRMCGWTCRNSRQRCLENPSEGWCKKKNYHLFWCLKKHAGNTIK